MTTPLNKPIRYLVTCEHASTRVPEECLSVLGGYVAEVEPHRLSDPGALDLAEGIASRLSATILSGEVTRLAVELNRSIGVADQFSPPMALACESLKLSLLNDYYAPFRKKALALISEAIEEGFLVVHLSVHTFSKVYEGEKRAVDLGILYDGERVLERFVGRRWVGLLSKLVPEYTVKSNQPYLGTDDGHTTALRRRYSADDYLGFEIELSQDLALDAESGNWVKLLCGTLRKSLIVKSD